MADTPVSHFVFVGSILATIVLIGVSLGTPNWIVLDNGDDDIYMGLFKMCYKDTCKEYKDDDRSSMSGLELIQGLVITGIVLFAMTVFLFCYMVATSKSIASNNIGKLILGLCIIGAITTWGGVGHFVRQTDTPYLRSVDHLWKYGYSMHLAWVAAIVGIVAGVTGMVSASALLKRRSPGGMGGVVYQQSGNPNPATVVIAQGQQNSSNAGYPMQLHAPNNANPYYPGQGNPMVYAGTPPQYAPK